LAALEEMHRAGDTPVSDAAVDELLAEQVRGLGPIIFFTRYPLSRPRMAGCAIAQSLPERWGCSIRVCDPASSGASARTLFEDPAGCICDLVLSRDARTVFFSLRRGAETCWQLYEIGVDGHGLRRISRDPRQHDVSPLELPDGQLLFVSTRSGGHLVSEVGPRSNLWLMRRDGSQARCVSQNTLADFSPQLMPDGRVLFSRWEYVDRDLEYRQGLWTQRPDGTMFQLFFGNTIRDVGLFWQGRPLPGHDDVVIATLAPPAGWPHGAIGLVTNRRGPELAREQGFAWITDESIPVGDVRRHADGMSYHDLDDGRLLELALRDAARQSPQDNVPDLGVAHELEARAGVWLDAARPAYRDPFPVSDHLFLVSYAERSSARSDLFLLDLCGNRVRLYADTDMGSYGPQLLRPSVTAPKLPTLMRGADRGETPESWGTLLLADVYQGLDGIVRGQARFLQIMEQVPKTHDSARRAYDQAPVMGYGTYYAKRCWGRVPIATDGSAYFDVPALKEIYLQVLDAEGRELQRQTSAIQVMPGETRSCLGCHEPRTAAPRATSPFPQAACQPPVRPLPPVWAREGMIDFDQVVQPVLDQYCTRCHSGPDPDGGCDLSSDRTRFFSMAYDHLLGRSRSYRQHNLTTGEMLSQEAARGRPLVHFYWLRRAPTGPNRPRWSGSGLSRIADYLTAAHTGQEMDWEDRQRIYTWIDANVPYYGEYRPSRPLTPGGRDRWSDPRTGRAAPWFAEGFLEVFGRRCAECHGEFPHPNDHDRIWDGRFAWINLTHPAWSTALTAHLSTAAGGRGLATRPPAAAPALFADTADPDYVRMLDAIRAGQRAWQAEGSD
jgi:hypothetical protein